jgi:ElaB/YqjD/DUF883 family membrane-anchored ribosome-binding protein
MTTITDNENQFSTTGTESSDGRLSGVRTKASETFSSARDRTTAAYGSVRERASDATRKTAETIDTAPGAALIGGPCPRRARRSPAAQDPQGRRTARHLWPADQRQGQAGGAGRQGRRPQQAGRARPEQGHRQAEAERGRDARQGSRQTVRDRCGAGRQEHRSAGQQRPGRRTIHRRAEPGLQRTNASDGLN